MRTRPGWVDIASRITFNVTIQRSVAQPVPCPDPNRRCEGEEEIDWDVRFPKKRKWCSKSDRMIGMKLQARRGRPSLRHA